MIKDKLRELFGLSVGNMSFRQYLEYLNTTGKITPRSQMEMTIMLLEILQEQENERGLDKKGRKS